MNKLIIGILLLGVVVMSCSKMDEYKKFTDGKEISYAGKADTVKVFSGMNRVKISWMLLSDPKINKTVIYWGNRSDSVVVNVERKPGVETLSYLLEGLKEGNYSFELVTYDNLGHKSVPAFKSAKVYGDKYVSSLLDRALLSTELVTQNTIMLKWGDAEATSTGVEILYQKENGTSQLIKLANTDKELVLNNYLKGSQFKYRTLFVPDSMVIDTFRTAYKSTAPIYEKRLDKSLFKDVTFPGDAAIYTNASNINKKFIWDGTFSSSFDDPYGNYLNLTTNDANKTQPLHISFDLGVTEQLRRFKLNHYYTYEDRAIRQYEIWGSANPPADGSWTGWVKMASVEQLKPSGKPIGSYNEADKVAWVNGDNVIFPSDLPKVRYIRIKCLKNWKGETNMSFSEVTFWAVD